MVMVGAAAVPALGPFTPAHTIYAAKYEDSTRVKWICYTMDFLSTLHNTLSLSCFLVLWLAERVKHFLLFLPIYLHNNGESGGIKREKNRRHELGLSHEIRGFV